jgi:hypothetical protein
MIISSIGFFAGRAVVMVHRTADALLRDRVVTPDRLARPPGS